MFTIHEIPQDAAEFLEQMGTKPKFWFIHSDGKLWLFKETRGTTGEHWSEKVASQICNLLSVPHASYELARWRGKNGVISPTFVPEGGRLVPGNEMFQRLFKDYDNTRRYGASQHTVRRVMGLLGRPSILLPEAGRELALKKASDLFLGYLLLDALIGNTDRHHENWGLIRGQRDVSLAPTFDHASSLGRNETDENRQMRLTTRDRPRSIAAYAAKSRSALYLHPTEKKPLLTRDAFFTAARMVDLGVREFWFSKLLALDKKAVSDALDCMPSTLMSNIQKEFCDSMIAINRGALIDRWGELG